MLPIVKFFYATNMYLTYSNSLFVLNLNEISIAQKELRGRAAHLVGCVHGTDLYRSAPALHALFRVSQIICYSLWLPAKPIWSSPVLRSFIHRVMILRGLKIDYSLFFSERTEDRSSWVGSSTHGYILIPSSLKTTLLWESLTQPCNKCILKNQEKYLSIFF